MAHDVPAGKKARVTWRFKRADGTDGKVEKMSFNMPLAEDAKQLEDGAWTVLVQGAPGSTGSLTVSADVDTDPAVDNIKDFPLADFNFLAEGQTETVSDIVVAVE